MLSRSLTGNKVAPAPLEGSEASPAPAVADAAVSEGQSAVDRTSAGPADGACRPDTVNAPVPQSLPSVAHPAIQPSLPSRQQSLPARPTLLSAKSGISWPEDAKEGGSKPLAVSRVPKGRAQRFFPSATAVDKMRKRRIPGADETSPYLSGRKQSLGTLAAVSGSSFDGTVTSVGSVFDQALRANEPLWREKIRKHLDGLWLAMLVVAVVLLALYLDDFRLACLPPAADGACTAIVIFVLVVFSIELILGSLVRTKFFLRFYFFIDLVATLSMLLDLPAITNWLANDHGPPGSGAGTSALNRGQSNAAGTRARQITRVCRILRLLRLVHLWQNYQLNKQARAMEVREGFVDVPQNSLLSQKFQKAARSKVGQRLTDLTILRVVLLVLLMLLLIPAFNVYSGVYGTQPNLNKGGLQVLHDLYLQQGDSPAFEVAKADYLTNMPWLLAYKRTDWVMDLVVCNQTLMRDLSGDGRRTVELATNRIQTPQCAQGIWEQCFVTIGVLNEYWNSQLNAALNILRTTFICLVIGGGAILLTRDANRLVLLPIERMLKKVKDVAENPLAKQVSITRKDTSGGMETRLLENSINKICSLLAIGFGDAGGQVIAKNMRSGGAIEPMIPGERVHAIFGFCDIRNFTDTTEVLQEGVMEFVNSIAEIVHQEVALHDGSPNKNIGDAFLLVWKLPPGFEPGLTAMAGLERGDSFLPTFSMESAAGSPARISSFSGAKRQPSLSHSKSLGRMLHFENQPGSLESAPSLSSQPLLKSKPSLAKPSIMRKLSMRRADRASTAGFNSRDSAAAAVHMADKALAAFVIIQAALKRSPRLQQYSQRADLNERMPDFQVKMGFGLHIGWAIEGAIGSNFKIDASYLSPNVNMASRLEAATKQFGTSILLSEDFVLMLSPRVRSRVRQIDRVTVKGSAKPMGLFTYDVALDKVAAPNIEPSVSLPTGLLLPARTADTAQAETFSAQVYNDEFAEHPDLKVTWAVNPAFMERFAEGYTAYETGEWARAKFILEETQASRRDAKGEPVRDGPSTALLNFMTEKGFQAPPGWKGWRELTEK